MAEDCIVAWKYSSRSITWVFSILWLCNQKIVLPFRRDICARRSLCRTCFFLLHLKRVSLDYVCSCLLINCLVIGRWSDRRQYMTFHASQTYSYARIIDDCSWHPSAIYKLKLYTTPDIRKLATSATTVSLNLNPPIAMDWRNAKYVIVYIHTHTFHLKRVIVAEQLVRKSSEIWPSTLFFFFAYVMWSGLIEQRNIEVRHET